MMFKQSGQVVVEFALVFGILAMLLLGMVLVALWMSALQVVTHAAHEGAREYALTLNSSRTEAVVRASFNALVQAHDQTEVIIDSPTALRGEYVTVSVVYYLPFALDGKLFPQGGIFKSVKGVAVARIECSPPAGESTCSDVQE